MEKLRWLGLLASLANSLLTGIVLSFNVYAVQLKDKFRFNQTQVEVVSSCFVMGMVFAVVAVPIYKRLGSRMMYVIVWILITASALLMWIATYHVEYLRTWVVFVCLFQLMLAIGCAFGQQCAMTIAIENCPKQHTGKLTGLFTALVGLGKLYYSTVMTFCNNNIGYFFLVLPVPFTVTLGVCFLFHTSQTGLDPERESLATLHGTKSPQYNYTEMIAQGKEKEAMGDRKADKKKMLKSGYFHVTLWSGILFHACSLSFMNNITHIAESVKLRHPLSTVDVLSLGVTFFRLLFGVIFDKFSSRRTGFILFSICYITFGIAMIIGLLNLTDVTIYVMIVLASVGSGAVFSLTLTMLYSEYAKDHYSFIFGIYFSPLGILTACCQVVVGRAYDEALSNVSHPLSLFFVLYVILLSVNVIIFALQAVYFICNSLERLSPS